MGIDQIAMALLGACAAWLSQARTVRARRWACVLGLLGQPFWFYVFWSTQQWGLLVVAGLYLCAWLRGLWVYWLAPQPEGEVQGSRLGTIQLTPGSGL
ncbi:hypothetical protein SAMN05428957_105245 [Oryzisolibacter propanilivorax]|uniref:Uncharacterized protein n=1 Tax=Oryzisolibacter propanilivorax TaxID=1527607 RepID=A0A1G9SZT3_9BURK|nr:hypothetical protein [Oryzisolibacter propanilivorax]SDM40951.1 hypothetical protein SAMN05428957_105245 [Oryzisolibacter propanilivorax]